MARSSIRLAACLASGTAILLAYGIFAPPCSAQVLGQNRTHTIYSLSASFADGGEDSPYLVVPASSRGLALQSEADDRAVEAIDAALARPMAVNFKDAPLREVRQAFQSQLGLAVHSDTRALNDAGVTEDTTFTFDASGQSGRTVLRHMLAEKDLNFVVQDGTIYVTTADAAKTLTITRVYPVADLTLVATADGNYTYDFDSLIEVITSAIAPSSWDSNGGNGTVAPYVESGALVISQTRENQAQIALLLEKLRSARHIQGLDAELVESREPPAKGQATYGGAFDAAGSGGASPSEAPAESTPPRISTPAVNLSATQPRWRLPRVYR